MSGIVEEGEETCIRELVAKLQRRRPLGRTWSLWEDDSKMGLNRRGQELDSSGTEYDQDAHHCDLVMNILVPQMRGLSRRVSREGLCTIVLVRK